MVQIVETFREHMQPAFVDRLDAWELAEQAGLTIPPVMIYGDDVTHILTEEGIANLLLCRSDEEREQAIRGVAGYTPVGMARDKRMVENLRDRGIIQRAEDIGIDKRLATRDLLAAKNMKDLVRASGGLYAAAPPLPELVRNEHMETLVYRFENGSRPLPAQAAGGRRGRLRQPRSADRIGAAWRRLHASRSRPPRSASAPPGRR